MKYKALMLDVDGTVTPYDYSKLPSDKVCDAIRRAQREINVCFVTGRSYPFLKLVLKKIGIDKGFAVVNNGAHVVRLEDEKILLAQEMDLEDVKDIVKVLKEEKIEYFVKKGLYDADYNTYPSENGHFKVVSMIFTGDTILTNKLDTVQKKLSHLNKVTVYKLNHGKFKMLNIQHVNATKAHGIEIILEQLKIKSEDAIGVGDSYNDFSLLWRVD